MFPNQDSEFQQYLLHGVAMNVKTVKILQAHEGVPINTKHNISVYHYFYT